MVMFQASEEAGPTSPMGTKQRVAVGNGERCRIIGHAACSLAELEAGTSTRRMRERREMSMRAADAVGLCLDVGLVFRRSAWRRSVFVAGPAREFAECRASSNYRGSLTVSLPIQSAEICPGAWSDCPPTKNERWRNGCGSRAGWAVLVTADGWEPGSDVDVRSVGAGCSLFRWIDAASGLQ